MVLNLSDEIDVIEGCWLSETSRQPGKDYLAGLE
jgi:hypothetical protein